MTKWTGMLSGGAVGVAVGVAGYLGLSVSGLIGPGPPQEDPAALVTPDPANAPDAPVSAPSPETAEVAAVPAEPEVEAPPVAEAEEAPEPLEPPTFGLRLEADGAAIVAGEGAPRAQIVIFLDNAEIADTVAGGDGKFASLMDIAPSPQPRVMTVAMRVDAQEVFAETEIIVAPFGPSPTPVEQDIVIAEAGDTGAEPETPPSGGAVPATGDAGKEVADGTAPEPERVASEGGEAEGTVIEDPDVPVAEAEGPGEDAPGVRAEAPESAPDDAPVFADAPDEPTRDRVAVTETSVEEVPAVLDEAPTGERADAVAEAPADVSEDQVAVAGIPDDKVPAAVDEALTDAPVEPGAEAPTEAAEDQVALADIPNDEVPAAEDETPPAEPVEPVLDAQTKEAEDQLAVADNPNDEVPPAFDEAATNEPVEPVAEVPAEDLAEAPDAEREMTVAAETPADETAAPVAEAAEDAPGATVGAVDVPETEQEAPTDAQATTEATGDAPVGGEGTDLVTKTEETDLAEADAPEAETEVAEDTATGAPEDEVLPRLLASDEDGVRVVSGPDVLDRVAIDTISYDEAGDVALAGRGSGSEGGGFVRVYLDNAPITTSRIRADGSWRVTLPEVDKGVYTLRVDEVDDEGEVKSRAETPFRREDRETLEAASEGADGGPVKIVTVQPGNTLWQIARERYGQGILYVRVFDANRGQIRDPDLIYPGQVFDLPEDQAAE